MGMSLDGSLERMDLDGYGSKWVWVGSVRVFFWVSQFFVSSWNTIIHYSKQRQIIFNIRFYTFSSVFIRFCPFLTFLYIFVRFLCFHQFVYVFVSFIRFYTFSSVFIGFRLFFTFSSVFIRFHPFLYIFISYFTFF